VHNACAENLSHESRRLGKRRADRQRNTLATKTLYNYFKEGDLLCSLPLPMHRSLMLCSALSPNAGTDFFYPLCAHPDAMKPKFSTQLELLSLLQRSLQRGENLNWLLPRRK